MSDKKSIIERVVEERGRWKGSRMEGGGERRGTRKAAVLILVMILVVSAFAAYWYMQQKEEKEAENQLPTADAGNDKTVNAGDIVQFNGVGSDPDGSVVLYEWDFNGDGSYDWSDTASGSTTHIYNVAGTYTAVLRVTDNKGATDTDTVTITVSLNLPPAANFTYTPQNPTDLQIVNFTDTSTDEDGSISSWYWEFGDGINSTLQNPTHQYIDNGTYYVNLTVWDNDNESANKSVLITVLNVAPVAGFTYLPGMPTSLDIINFTDLSTDYDGDIVSWFWVFGDSNTSSEQNPSHKYALIGSYTVNLTVTDNDGVTNTCSLIINVSQPVIDVVLEDIGSHYESIELYWPLGNAISNATVIDIDVRLNISCMYPTIVEVTGYSISSEPYGVWLVSVSPLSLNLSPGAHSILLSVNITPQNISIVSPENISDAMVTVTFSVQVVVSTTDTPTYYNQWTLPEEEYPLTVVWEFSNSTDYDYDGIPDAAEVWLGLNPANSSDALLDPDNDGLDNLHEYLNGTNLYDDDTDGDQLGDGFELIFSKTDPTDWDTDNDGIGDGLEFIQNQGYSGSMQTLPEGWLGMTISTSNYTMYAETNSSIIEGKYDKDKKTLRIKIHGPPDTVGVANITIPKGMVDSEKDIKIQLDGHTINYTFSENSTHYFIHVEYTHSMHEIAARFTPVINVTADKPVGATVNSMHLAWSQTTDPGEYDCYEIYQSTLPGAVGVLIYTETDYTVTTCTVTNLSPGVTYYFTVRTVYKDGFYADSNPVFEKTMVGAVLFEDPDTGTKVNIKYTGTGSLSIVNVSQPGTIPAKMQSIGVFIEITTPPSISTEWAYIEIPYDSNALPAGVKEAGLRMYYWTGIEWKKCDNTGVDTDNNVVWANVTHFTIFAPMAEKTAAPVSLLPYIIIFAITIVLIGAGLGFKMMRKEKPVTVKCQKCGETIDITGLEKPVEVVCPKCGAKETLEEGKG